MTYTLTSKVPDMTGYTSYVFNFKDTLSAGLTFKEITSVKVGDTTITKVEAGQEANDTYTLTQAGQDITITMNNFLALMSGKTNSDGEVMYRDLEKGVYLFIQTQKTQIGNQVYQSESFIITVPGNYDGQIIWNVTAEPKFKNESIPPITTNTPPVSEEPSGDNSSHTPNVKTGDDTNVIMWLSLMGISLVIFSMCKRKVHK